MQRDVVARQTNTGVPVLYMPYRFMDRIQRHTDNEYIENSLDDILSRVYIIYDNNKRGVPCMIREFEPQPQIPVTKTIKVNEDGTIKIHVFFFDKICSYLDLCDVVIDMNPTWSNAFTFAYLLEYAHYKLDVKLINILLQKICDTTTLFDVSIIMNLVEDMFKRNIIISIPEEYSERLLAYYMHKDDFRSEFRGFFSSFDPGMLGYVVKCIGSLSYQSTVSIIFNDKVDLVIQLYDKMKKAKKKATLLHCAMRYESKNVLEYLYQLEKPIKEYVDIKFLTNAGIDPDSKTVLEDILEERDFDFIKRMYKNTTNLRYLNKRIALFISVKKNDYQTVEFLLSKGVKPDQISLVYTGYYGSLEMMKLMIRYSAKIDDVSIYYAAYSGSFELIKYIYKNIPKKKDSALKNHYSYSILDYLSDGGHLILDNEKSLDLILEVSKDEILNYVCREKDIELEVVEYLYNRNASIDKYTMNMLASSGSLEVFRFFMSRGIPIDQHTMGNLATRGQYNLIRGLYNSTIPVISLTGQVGTTTVTRFFDKNKRELDYLTVYKGIQYGAFEIKQSFVVSRSNQMLLTDLTGGNKNSVGVGVDILDNFDESPTHIDCTIYNQLPPVDEGTIQTTARHRHIDLLLFLISKKVPIDQDAMYDAIVRGFTDIVVLLYEYYPVLNNNHITLAKLWNRYEILDFFSDKKIVTTVAKPHTDFIMTPFDYYNKSVQQILYHACSHGELDVLKSYRGSLNIILVPTIPTWNASMYKHDHRDMFYVAILHGQMSIITYLESRNTNNNKSNAEYIACAVRIGRIDLVKYLIKEGYTICEKSMTNAIEKCRFDLVKYLVSINAPIPLDALKIAKKYNAVEIYDFLINKSL